MPALPVAVALEWWVGDRTLDDWTRMTAGHWAPTVDGLVGNAGSWRIRLVAESADDGLELRLAIEHVGPGVAPPLRGVELSVAGFAPPAGAADRAALRVAYCGAHSRSVTSRSFVRSLGRDDIEGGWWVGALSGPTGPSIVLGADSVDHFATEIRMASDRISAYQHLEHWTLAAGERVAVESLWLTTSDAAPLTELEQFASRLGARYHAAPGTPPCGWGSWGHWLERIDIGLMRETVLALDGIPSLRGVVRVVQIDDGWSELLESGRVSASWRPNRRFPSGIAPLAAEIQRNGRDCGLWLLPFTVNGGSAIVEQHPDWLVQNADGAPFRIGGVESYCLDPTHPEAADWLRDLFSQMRDWGVRYVKLDHLRALMAPDPAVSGDRFDTRRHFHGARTRVEAYRAGLSLIRDAMGDDVTIVGCSAPAAPGVGLVNAHRVGPDIEPKWVGHASGVRDSARALLANWFWQGRTWINDPDYLLPCDSETLTRFWATVVALSGGSAVLSADFANLQEWEERILSIVTPPLGAAARPLDLFERPNGPSLLHLPLAGRSGSLTLLGVLNWDDRPRTETIALSGILGSGAWHVYDVWRGAHRIVRAESLRVPLDAHDAALLAFLPVAAHPQVVGSDIHFAQGRLVLAAEEWDGATGTLTLRIASTAPRAGQLRVWMPDGWRRVDDTESRDPSGLLSLSVRPGDTVALRFGPSAG